MVGGDKFDSSKSPLELIPATPLFGVADVLAFGAKKYSRWNWYQGLQYSRLVGAALRHIQQFNNGEDRDDETDLLHIDHAITELMFLSTFLHEGRQELDDRPDNYSNSGGSIDGSVHIDKRDPAADRILGRLSGRTCMDADCDEEEISRYIPPDHLV